MDRMTSIVISPDDLSDARSPWSALIGYTMPDGTVKTLAVNGCADRWECARRASELPEDYHAAVLIVALADQVDAILPLGA